FRHDHSNDGRQWSDGGAERTCERVCDGRSLRQLHVCRTGKWDVHHYPESRKFYVYSSQPEHGHQWGQRYRSDLHGECGRGWTDDHDATSQSDGDGGTDGYVRSSGRWNRTVELPVAEEWGEHRGSDFGKLHNAGNRDFR